MFSYYGSKSKIVDLYPAPKHGLIIEPFAGSARYALKYFDREVLLVDRNETIIDLWKWLQSCEPSDLNRLPRLKSGENLNDFNLSVGEKLFMSFLVNEASTGGRLTATERSASKIDYKIKQTKKILYQIKHWKLELNSYESIVNQKATWFIDPPYQFGGEYYKYSSKQIDFQKLAIWSQEREGQVIVCENTKADWLNFKTIKPVFGGLRHSTEAIWTNEPTQYDNEQLKIAI